MMLLKPIICGAILCTMFTLSACHFTVAEDAEDNERQIVRFYKLNDKDQQNRLLIRESRLSKTGCQNFATQATIYRLTQIGFEYCQIFEEKNCVVESIIDGLWKGETADTEFTQGGQWLFTHHTDEGVKARSWECQ